MSAELAARIKALAAEVGYAACGITTAEHFEDFSRAIEQRIARFPEAADLYAPMRGRADPRNAAPWASSIIVCLRRYGKYELPEGLTGHIGRNYLADQRIQECPDYAMPEKMKEGLLGLGLRVRKGGVPDRAAAARAGVARVGRNCFAYSEHGSWINIATWLVDAGLPPDEPTLEPPCPEDCRACIEACPTAALIEPFLMRMDRCVAYLTYSAPEPIPAELRERMGTWIYGCDACQEACPLNTGKWEANEKAPWLEELAPHLTPQALAEMDEETYRNIVHPRFSYISADNLQRWHANAARALAASRRAKD